MVDHNQYYAKKDEEARKLREQEVAAQVLRYNKLVANIASRIYSLLDFFQEHPPEGYERIVFDGQSYLAWPIPKCPFYRLLPTGNILCGLPGGGYPGYRWLEDLHHVTTVQPSGAIIGLEQILAGLDDWISRCEVGKP